jgi:hypothetical protein
MNGWTPTPTNPERLAYDAERRAYWEAKSLAYAMEHDKDPRISRREEILAAFHDEPLNKQEADALYSELAEIDQALQFHPSDTLNEYIGYVMRSDYEIKF